MHLRSRRIKMTENRFVIHDRNPNSSLSYENQPNEDPVSHLIQRISKPGKIISKLLNIDIESLEVTNIECSLTNISSRMLSLETMVHDIVQPSQFNEKEQICVKLGNPPLKLPMKRKRKTKIIKVLFSLILRNGTHQQCLNLLK